MPGWKRAFEEPIAIAEESSRVRRDRAGHAVFARPATGDDPEFADALLGRVAVGDGA
jgi:sirohydrochlorin ferrochelatase